MFKARTVPQYLFFPVFGFFFFFKLTGATFISAGFNSAMFQV